MSDKKPEVLNRLRDLAVAVALNPKMDTRHGETADLAHDTISQLELRCAALEALARDVCSDNYLKINDEYVAIRDYVEQKIAEARGK